MTGGGTDAEVERFAVSASNVTQLVPQPGLRLPLRGLYLGRDLRRERRADRAYCYSNFVVSVDGRVSVSSSPELPPRGVPSALASPGDWRLFQELVAQADAVLVSGRYVRDVAANRAEPLVQLDRPGLDDLREWRRHAGLGDAPDVVVVSSSLDVDPEATLRLGPRVTVVTGDGQHSDRAEQLQRAGIDVMSAGDGAGIDGRRLAALLAQLGYHTVYAAIGPSIFHLLVDADVMDRLFVTTVHRLLGGERFATLIEGGAFHPPVGLGLEALYLDEDSRHDATQSFAVYSVIASPHTS